MNNNEVVNISICFEDLRDFMNANPSKFTKAKNGKTYIGMVVKARKEADKMGNDVSVSFSQTKEEREAKAQVVYIGSGKTFTFGNYQNNAQSNSKGSDLPF